MRLPNFLSITLLILLAACGKSTEADATPDIIHTSLLPETWYVHNAGALNKQLNSYFALAEKYFNLTGTGQPRAIIAPHAGFAYSGLCAATAYQALLEPGSGKPDSRKNRTINRVIILAPCHHQFYHGIALPDYTIYRTVLGDLPVDKPAMRRLNKHELFNVYADVHLKEHAIEMQLPFLQKTIDDFTIVPLIVGKLTTDSMVKIAQELLQIIDEHTLIVVSSDFVHHGKSYDYELFTEHIMLSIRRLDSLAIQALATPSYEAFNELLINTNATICGQEPLKLLLTLLEGGAYKIIAPEVTSYYTSPQIEAATTPESIDCKKLLHLIDDQAALTSVSYVGLVFREHDPADKAVNLPAIIEHTDRTLNGFEQASLLQLARTSIVQQGSNQQIPAHLLQPIVTPGLEVTAGAFVTLHRGPNLRGCIGRTVSEAPLYQTVYNMSLAAAFNDTRFLPVAPGELEELTIDISVLSPPKQITNTDEIIIGKHGIIMDKHDTTGNIIASAVFLPNVPQEQNWSREETLEQLAIKADLPRDGWKTDCTFHVFEGYEIKEKEHHAN